jgi:hypothetical protein
MNVVRMHKACVACDAGKDVSGAGGVAMVLGILRAGETIDHVYECLCPEHRTMVDTVHRDIEEET